MGALAGLTVLVVLAALAGAKFTQVAPATTDFTLYGAATDGHTVVLRGGTAVQDAVYPLMLVTRDLGVSGSLPAFNSSNLPALEYSTYVNTLGHSLVFLGGEAQVWLATVSAFPLVGTRVFVSDDAMRWVEQAGIASVSPGTMRTNGAGTLVVLPDEGQSLFAYSTDYGANWNTTASPLARGLGPDALALGDDAWAVFRYDLGNASEYTIMVTSAGPSLPSFVSFTALPIPGVTRVATDAVSTVFAVLASSAGFVVALTDSTTESLSFVRTPSLHAPASAWAPLARVPLPGLSTSGVALDVVLCATSGLGLVRFTNGSDATVQYATTDSFASLVAVTVPDGESTVAALELASGCLLVGLGADGFVAASGDGEQWAVVPNSPLVYEWASVLWVASAELFVAVGDATILLSTDGVDWQTSPLPAVELATPFVAQTGDAQSLFCGATSAGLFCATSVTATVWAYQVSSAEGCVAAAFGNGVFVYADASSVDAHLWTAASPDATFKATYRARGSVLSESPVFTSVSFSSGNFWAFAQLETHPKLVRSTDGVHWTDVLRPLGGCSFYGVLASCGPLTLLQCADAGAIYAWTGGDAWANVLTVSNTSEAECSRATCTYLTEGVETATYFVTVGSEAFASTDGRSFAPVAPPAENVNTLQFPAMASNAYVTVALGEFCDTTAGSFIYAQST